MAAAEDLVAALGRLEIELSTADEVGLADGLAQLARFRTRCDAVWLQLVAEAERRGTHRRHGARDIASWIATIAGERRGVARREAELASRLERSRIIADALAVATVSSAKAAELVRADDLPDEVQERLVEHAARLPVEQVAAEVEQARLAHGAAEVPVAPTLRISRTSTRAVVEATLDLVEAEVLEVALSTAVTALDLPTTMPYAERRARGLAAIARFYLDRQATVTTSRLGRPHVLVMVDLEVLEARAGGSATLASGTVISGAQARRLAEDANISRIITNGPSEPLDVGRATRSIPPAIAKAVMVRDRHCRYERCRAPGWACDVHHRRPWAQGGPTALTNLGLLCWFHHEEVHRRGAERLRVTAEGRWTLEPAHERAAGRLELDRAA